MTVKQKREHERKFGRHTGFFCGIQAEGTDMSLLFDEIQIDVLRTVADELTNEGFCVKAEVADGKITMMEWEMLFCNESGLIGIIDEILKENNYELILR